MVYPCVCWSIFFFFGGGTPQIPRLCVYPDRRADIWSPHEPQAPMSNMEQKTSNFLSGLLQMCARSPHISVLEPYIIYHTLCLVLHPSILVWLPNISPVPTRPPTLRSLYHPLTWLHTNEILHTGSIISGFCWGFFSTLMVCLKNFLVRCFWDRHSLYSWCNKYKVGK